MQKEYWDLINKTKKFNSSVFILKAIEKDIEINKDVSTTDFKMLYAETLKEAEEDSYFENKSLDINPYVYAILFLAVVIALYFGKINVSQNQLNPNYLFFKNNQVKIEKNINKKFNKNKIIENKDKGIYIKSEGKLYELIRSKEEVEFKKLTDSQIETVWFFYKNEIFIASFGIIFIYITFSVIPKLMKGYKDWWRI